MQLKTLKAFHHSYFHQGKPSSRALMYHTKKATDRKGKKTRNKSFMAAALMSQRFMLPRAPFVSVWPSNPQATSCKN